MLIEPQCWGLEHASFNAALIDTVLLAYPKEQLVFFGEESHLTSVRRILDRYDSDEVGRVSWRDISIPKRGDTGWLRFIREWREFGSFLREVQKGDYQHFMFTSITNTGILVLKIKVYYRKFPFPIITVLHGMLHTIVGRWPHKPWNWPLNIRFVLRFFQSDVLRYLVLGESIYRSVAEVQPNQISNFKSLDLPNFEYNLYSDKVELQKGKPIFGYIGTGNKTKGIGAFAKIAQECIGLKKDVVFLLVGYLSSWRDDAAYSFVSGISEKQLTTDEFIQRGLSLTYSVNTSNPDFYRFGGCSSFIDALFFGKPGIYLRNRYIEYYFDQMGDIGYLCDSIDEMICIIKSIIIEFPSERYIRQVENIEKGRLILTPKYLAPKLKEILEESQN